MVDRLTQTLNPDDLNGKFVTGAKKTEVGSGQISRLTFSSLRRRGFGGSEKSIPAVVLAEMTEDQIKGLDGTGQGIGDKGVQQIKKALLELASKG